MVDRQQAVKLYRKAQSLGYPNLGGTAVISVAPFLRTFVSVITGNRAARLYFETRGVFNLNNYSGEYRFKLHDRFREQRNMPTLRITPHTLGLLSGEITQLFTRMLQYVISIRRLTRLDKLQVVISDGNSFVSTGVEPSGVLRAGGIMRLIENTLQSWESLDFNTTSVVIRYFRGIQGGAHFSTSISCIEFIKKKRCIVTIESVNSNCFFQCLVLGLAQNNDSELYREMVRDKRSLLQVHTNILYETSGGALGTSVVSLSEIPEYEVANKININVIEFISMSFIYKSSYTYSAQCFFLYVENMDNGIGHFHYVNRERVGSLWDKRKFCFICYKGYQNIRHTCIEKCVGCKRATCEGRLHCFTEFGFLCRICNMKYYNNDCYQHHLKRKCSRETRCVECGVIYNPKKTDHFCGYRTCANCSACVSISETHECYHQPLHADKVPVPNEKYIFYDYEATIDDNHHNVAGVVAMYFHDPTPIRFTNHDDFITWLFSEVNHGYTCIAHNGGRYDVHYIKKSMIERGIKSSDVVNGNTIFYCNAKKFKMRFIDSYRFIPSALRGFTKTFGICEITKGYFPYTFFTKETINYVGPMPDVSYFGFDSMKTKDRVAGLQWYSEHKDDQIDLYEMCMKYCESDVALLREGCIRFRNLFMSITGGEIDPFRYITIASVCMTIYKRFHMPGETIGVLHQRTNSKERQQWLDYITTTTRGFVQNTSVNGIKIDGYDAKNKICYLFNSCLLNGCRYCYDKFTVNPINFTKCYECRFAWCSKVTTLKELGHHCHTIWACEWKKMVLSNKDVQQFLLTYIYNDSEVNLRDAFYGGRTEPVKLYRKAALNEDIKYYDYTSLYPSVQYGEHRGITEETYNTTKLLYYPTGHPTIINDNFGDINEYFGVAKCDVECPQDLYLPILPEKKNGKLMFDLTKKTGTWTTIELQKAVELGYKITKIYQIAHFEQKSDNLFQDYVKTFLKIKQEAAGWNKLGCESDEEKQLYISEYSRVQHIDLDPNNITDEYNPGLYFIAKLCLNSLWGKFGQRDMFAETIDTFDRKTFNKYVHSDKYDVQNVVLHNNLARTVTFMKKKEFASVPKNTNIVIAAFTTAHARLRLYEALEILGPKVLYMDTDSVIYTCEKGKNPLKCGPFLGDLTDELDGSNIVEFVTTGPKSYAYREENGKTQCKVKGFTLNHETSEQINFDNMKYMILEDNNHAITTKPLQFVINPTHGIKTKSWGACEGKRFRLTFDKRKICWDNDNDMEIDTLPITK